MTATLTAEAFVGRLLALQSDDELRKIQRYFKSGEGEYSHGDTFIGVRMGSIFALAKEFIDMPPVEIEKLLLDHIHEVRVGALSIMGKQAARKKTPPERRAELYDLYIRRIDRVNNWDLVDLSAHHVIGGYLADRPRDILYELARSDNLWHRRIAMFSTMHFIRHGDLDDTFAIAEILVHDEHDLIHKVTGWALRTAGGVDPTRLRGFLDRHAATAPRTLLRAAIENLPEDERRHYLALKKAAQISG